MTDVILDIHDLHVEFRGKRHGDHVRAVDGISLQVHAGEVVSLVGESGCGKTTTANAVLGLTAFTSGHISVDGVDIATADRAAMKTVRSRMQMIAQDPYESLNPRMTIEEIVTEPLTVHGRLDGDRRERAMAALEAAGLTPPEEFIDRRPHELSGGQRQRVVIAAALSVEPSLLIADEPVSMLDVSVRAGILNLLKRLAEEKGIGVLMITHDLATVAAYSDRIAVMYLGRIVEAGATLDVIADPEHPYTRALISVVPSHDPAMASHPTLLVGETPDASRIPAGCRFHPRCPAVFDPCSTVEPELVETAPGRLCACLLYGESPGT